MHLEQKEAIAQQLKTSRLQTLLNWATQVTADSGEGYTLTAKKVAAIYLLLDRDRAFAQVIGYNRANGLRCTIEEALSLACILGMDFNKSSDLTHARNLNSDPNLARELATALYHNHDFDLAVAIYRELIDAFESAGIFNGIDLEALTRKLEKLKTQGADPGCYQNTWLDAFYLDLDWLALSEEEVHTLEDYFRTIRKNWEAIV